MTLGDVARQKRRGAHLGDAIQNIAQAIANAEGYGLPNVIPTLQNNPGDIKSGGAIATYSTPQEGWDALYNQISAMVSGSSRYYNPSQTWTQIGNTYAGGDPNWAVNVARSLGVDPNSTLGDYLSGSSTPVLGTSDLTSGMANTLGLPTLFPSFLTATTDNLSFSPVTDGWSNSTVLLGGATLALVLLLFLW